MIFVVREINSQTYILYNINFMSAIPVLYAVIWEFTTGS